MDTGHRVLVIDDDPIYVRSTTAILESNGYRVDSARDGAEALRKMKQDRPDLVLLVKPMQATDREYRQLPNQARLLPIVQFVLG